MAELTPDRIILPSTTTKGSGRVEASPVRTNVCLGFAVWPLSYSALSGSEVNKGPTMEPLDAKYGIASVPLHFPTGTSFSSSRINSDERALTLLN